MYTDSEFDRILAENPAWQELLLCAKSQSVAQFKALLVRLISEIDTSISEQLSDVIQHPNYKQLEASWTGLKSLAQLQVSQRRVKIKMLDLSWSMVSADLNYSFDLKQSSLYRKLYSNELDTAGGSPFGMVMVDHKVSADYADDQEYDDLYTLQLLSELGELSFCPMVLGTDEFFFGDEPTRLLHDSARIDRILTSRDFVSWQLLREKSSSRFLHLVMPEHLIRQPYRQYQAGFVFNERQQEKYALWGSSAYLLLGNVMREFDRISWFGFLRSYDETGSYGAIVQDSKELKTKVDIYSEEDGFWSSQGFMPLTSIYLSGHKGFFSNQSVWQAPDEAQRQLGMLQTNLMACRFAHYIKVQIRDQVGRYDSAESCRRSLERWLEQFISNVNYGEDAVLARYPLRSCYVRIEEAPHDKTRYLCEIMLQPQYQYEMMDAKVVLTTSVSGSEVGETS
ncbi:TPA: type VI secretion system contractile sheath large subunit [Vibrio parahaemolyticus]|uniref:type VI secretion system contractile sheath domain-containing protein n=1 Tax=Vibrio parahaemolyticus TaxID=670 RepID=UPI00111F8492|nr:type VI secretion system contractile sheath large subunit [Vibrio parahaemolyticus]TOQ76573.1 type VI secretion protein [Vibrio parahaemolyticus]HCE5205642.1 type VI secretion system contractile sheath large subunit [Vibrio parahaemolyticus]HCH3682056.1 type VI secretion system contractile sheath large subunit [Vibrio parahaemolyticus]HCH6179050.1 type VI secretion system contractile sheath large subunit [Vibrio parahaemolyticus]HCH6570518.1 type VI secretion system contractile sheath large